MHKCKVQSTKPANIQKEEYNSIYHQIKHDDFFQPLNKLYQQYPYSALSQIILEAKSFHIPMKRNLIQLLEIKGRIHQEKVRFLIDTGAQISAIRAPLFKKLGLKTFPALEIGSFGGNKVALESVVVDVLAFGKIKVLHHPMIVLDDHTFQMKVGPIDLLSFDAILGWDILSRIDFELDDIQHCFKVVEQNVRFKYPNAIKGSFPFMLARGRNEVLKLGIDTGAYYSWISKDYMKEHQIQGIPIETISYGVHGKEKNPSQMMPQFDLLLDRGYIQLTEIIQGPCDIFSTFHYDAILGNEIFKGRRIRFLNSVSMVLFT